MSPTRAPVALLLSLLAACAAPTPPPAPVVAAPPPATPTAATPPSAVASAPPAPPPAPPALPVDPAADRDKLAIVSAICPAAIKHEGGKVLVGCRTCPPFTDTPPDGRVAVDPPQFFPLESRYPGAFTRAGAEETAAVFQGCEPHAANYGGTQLVDKVAGGYRAGAYFSGVHPDSCQPYRRADGRDLLVCQWADAHQSIGTTSVFAYDFVASTPDDVEKGWKPLVTIHDNAAGACLGLSPELGLQQGRVLGFRFEDRNHDGRLDVAVDVEHRRTAHSAALEAKVARACKARGSDDAPPIDVTKLVGAPVKATLELLSDGKTFHPTAATARTLKALDLGF